MGHNGHNYYGYIARKIEVWYCLREEKECPECKGEGKLRYHTGAIRSAWIGLFWFVIVARCLPMLCEGKWLVVIDFMIQEGGTDQGYPATYVNEEGCKNMFGVCHRKLHLKGYSLECQYDKFVCKV